METSFPTAEEMQAQIRARVAAKNAEWDRRQAEHEARRKADRLDPCKAEQDRAEQASCDREAARGQFH